MKGMNIIKLAGAWLFYPLRLVRYKRDEWFDLVTPSGRPIGRAPRTVCHRGPGLLHPVVHLHVTDGEGRLYLQKRSMTKKIQPGKWDTSVGGHVDSGETVETALRRETREELGLVNITPRFLRRYVWISEQESELVNAYTAPASGEICFDPVEIDEGRFWTPAEIDGALGKGILTPNFEQEYGKIREELFL